MEYEPGQLVFQQDDRSDLVYTIEDGEVELVCHRPTAPRRSWPCSALAGTSASYRPLFGLQRSATARAVKHAVLTGYGAHDFRDLVGSGRLAEAIRRPSY